MAVQRRCRPWSWSRETEARTRSWWDQTCKSTHLYCNRSDQIKLHTEWGLVLGTVIHTLSTSLLPCVWSNQTAHGMRLGVGDSHTHIHVNNLMHVHQHNTNNAYKKLTIRDTRCLCKDRGRFSQNVLQQRLIDWLIDWLILFLDGTKANWHISHC